MQSEDIAMKVGLALGLIDDDRRALASAVLRGVLGDLGCEPPPLDGARRYGLGLVGSDA